MIHSLKGKEVELMLQPLPWQLQGMYSAPGYSFGEHLGCHVRAGKEVSKGEMASLATFPFGSAVHLNR